MLYMKVCKELIVFFQKRPDIEDLNTCIRYRLVMNFPLSHSHVFPFSKFFILTVTLGEKKTLKSVLKYMYIQFSADI